MVGDVKGVCDVFMLRLHTIKTTRVIGASLSEPHTSESNSGFFIYILYIIYLPYVRIP